MFLNNRYKWIVKKTFSIFLNSRLFFKQKEKEKWKDISNSFHQSTKNAWHSQRFRTLTQWLFHKPGNFQRRMLTLRSSHRRCSIKRVPRAGNFTENAQVFPYEFFEILRTSFSQNTSRRLLLNVQWFHSFSYAFFITFNWTYKHVQAWMILWRVSFYLLLSLPQKSYESLEYWS